MTDANFVRRRYLALWFPFLSTDRLRITRTKHCGSPGDTLHEAGASGPLVLVAKVRGALRLQAADARAQALGIVPGLALADARALQSDLVVAEMDEAADQHWLKRLARRCTRWSPLVSTVPPDGITLDITGAEHLFGGEAGMAVQIEEALAAAGMTLRLAAAHTPEAAQALARYAAHPIKDELQAIRALPVVALGLEAEASLALRRAGLKTIGDVGERPAASIAARFGLGAITALRRLTGEEQAPINPLAVPAPLHFEHRFAEPITLQSMVAACFADLLHEAARLLETRDLGGRCFVLNLLRSDGETHRLEIVTGAPTRDPALVLRLFDERIAALADPLDPGFGYDCLRLAVMVVEPLAAVQGDFDGNRAEADGLAELIDRLSTRLGPGAVRRIVPQDSHIPEQAQLALPAIRCPAPQRWPNPVAGEPVMRPLFLFDPPRPVEVIAEVPDGPPLRFRWRSRLHEVRLYEGPERIASEWWQRKGGANPGSGGLTRDYYRIEDGRGRRYWIFRHGLYDEKPDPRWYLHGLFA